MKITLSIINYNGAKKTLSCLASLEKMVIKGIDLSVIVVDNASNEEINIDEKKYKNISVRLVKNSSNTGFSGGHNTAIHKAVKDNSNYVMILNNDTTVDKNLLRELLLAIEKDKKIGIVVPKIYFMRGTEFHKERYKESELGKVIWYAGGEMNWNNIYGYHTGVDEVDNGQFDANIKTNFATGCCMLVRTDVFTTVGFLNEDYFLYYEDSDFSMRVRNAGYSIIFVPEAILWHENAGSTGGSGSSLQDYYISRNRLLFGFTYASFRTRVALIRESIRLMRKGREWQKKGVIDFFLHKLGKGGYAV